MQENKTGFLNIGSENPISPIVIKSNAYIGAFVGVCSTKSGFHFFKESGFLSRQQRKDSDDYRDANLRDATLHLDNAAGSLSKETRKQAHEIVLRWGNNAVSDIMPTFKLPSDFF
jgi:hypothetical protein